MSHSSRLLTRDGFCCAIEHSTTTECVLIGCYMSLSGVCQLTRINSSSLRIWEAELQEIHPLPLNGFLTIRYRTCSVNIWIKNIAIIRSDIDNRDNIMRSEKILCLFTLDAAYVVIMKFPLIYL